MLPSEQLLAAADAIRTFGWCQWEARDYLMRAYRAQYGVDAPPIGRWNDAPERIADDVIELLHAAAHLAESEGR